MVLGPRQACEIKNKHSDLDIEHTQLEEAHGCHNVFKTLFLKSSPDALTYKHIPRWDPVRTPPLGVLDGFSHVNIKQRNFEHISIGDFRACMKLAAHPQSMYINPALHRWKSYHKNSAIFYASILETES